MVAAHKLGNIPNKTSNPIWIGSVLFRLTFVQFHRANHRHILAPIKYTALEIGCYDKQRKNQRKKERKIHKNTTPLINCRKMETITKKKRKKDWNFWPICTYYSYQPANLNYFYTKYPRPFYWNTAYWSIHYKNGKREEEEENEKRRTQHAVWYIVIPFVLCHFA